MKVHKEDIAHAESFFTLYEEMKPKISELERKFSPENWSENKLLVMPHIDSYMKTRPYITTRVVAVTALASKADNEFDLIMLFACITEDDITAFKNWIEKHK